MTSSNTEKEIAKLDPYGPDYGIFVKALRKFDGLTAETLKAYVESRGLTVDLLPNYEAMNESNVERDKKTR